MPTILTCAVTGGRTRREQSPYLPITPAEIAASALEAADAGAAIVHLHVRDPKSGLPSMDVNLYAETVERIRRQNPRVLINLTTGPGADFVPSPQDPSVAAPGTLFVTPEARVRHIEQLRPELCTVDFNTMPVNDGVRINTKASVTRILELIQRAGTKPELEIFNSGDLRLALELVSEGIVEEKPLWQLVLGVPYGWPATIQSLLFGLGQLPAGSCWAALGVGRNELPIVAQAFLQGGHVRVGLEDNLYRSRGVLARTNAELVGQAVELITLLGGQVATPEEAREILGLEVRS